jgi:tetratricopeptide (TPR) repeat protein
MLLRIEITRLTTKFKRLTTWIALLIIIVAVGTTIAGAVWRGHLFPRDTTTVYNVLFDIARVLLLFFVVALLLLLLFYLSTSAPPLTIAPFDVTTAGDKIGGAAVSSSLEAELRRISWIHTQQIQAIDRVLPAPYRVKDGGLAPNGDVGKLFDNLSAEAREDASPQGDIPGQLNNLGTFEVAGMKIPIGPMLALLRDLWPLGARGSRLHGTVQRFGTVVRLSASLPNVLSCDVSDDLTSDNALPELVRCLAFQIAHRLPSDSTPGSWEAYRWYTEARAAYLRFRQTGQTDELEVAVQRCLDAAEEDPRYGDNWLLFTLVAQTLANEEQFDAAEGALRRAIALTPGAAGRAAFFVLLGNVYKMDRRFDEAKVAFDRALRLQPNNPLFHSGIGYVYIRQCRPDDALASFQRAVRLDEKDASFHVSLASMYKRRFDDDACARELRCARQLYCEKAKSEKDKRKKARHGKAEEASEGAYECALYAAVAGDVEQAVDLLRKALEKGAVSVPWLRYDPDLDFIRNAESFTQLLVEYDREPPF